MSRSGFHNLSLSAMVLVSILGLGISCGSPGRVNAPHGAAGVPAEKSSNSSGSLVVVPTVVATMSLIESGVAQEISEYLVGSARADEEKVQVTFRLGPRMASRTFTIGMDGQVSPEDAKKLRRMFRCRRSGRSRRMNQGLYAKIADLADHYQGHTIEVVSAYRHGRNAKKSSRHRHGRAIDIKVVGVPAARVRDYLWARYDAEVGVGFYKQQQFVHLDHRTNYPATAWTQRHHSAENEYKPRWSRSSRRSKLVVALADAGN